MAVIVGTDLGTTKITALALDTSTGAVLASCAAANQAETTAPDDKVRGFSEWDAAPHRGQRLCVPAQASPGFG